MPDPTPAEKAIITCLHYLKRHTARVELQHLCRQLQHSRHSSYPCLQHINSAV